MAKYNVTFLPANITITIEEHCTVLEAAEQAGVHLNRLCGGDGMCGRCKAILRSGVVGAEPTIHLTREEVQQGYVLACKCYLRSDAVFEVPSRALKANPTRRMRTLYASVTHACWWAKAERIRMRHSPKSASCRCHHRSWKTISPIWTG